MPTGLAEKPVLVDTAHPGAANALREEVQVARATSGAEKLNRLQPTTRRQRFDRLLHEIFEGREEFLGWTPD